MSLTKIGSIGINTGIQLAGVTTVSTLKVGSGVTLSSDGDIFATGVTTTGSLVSSGAISGTTGTFSDDVNITARLEAKTKEYNCCLVVSKIVAEIAGIDVTAFPVHVTEVRGREANVEIIAVKNPSDLIVPSKS